MAEPKPTVEQPAAEKQKQKRHRSPGFPFIDLKVALARAKTFYEKERRHAASFKVAASHWGFKEKSSGGLQTAAALKSFGLMKDVEAGPAGRTLQLTDLALRILLDERESSSEREVAIKKAALLPKIHARFWQAWGAELPSDAELRHRLLFEPYDFNENVVDDFIKEYKDTIAFAKLTSSDTISSGLEDNQAEEEGKEEAGMPEVQQHQPVAKQPPQTKDGKPQVDRPPVPGTRQDVFSLTEGTVAIQWPASLSPESFEDLSAWLDILKRKIGRSVTKEEPTGQERDQ